jgi:hypothetical protein
MATSNAQRLRNEILEACGPTIPTAPVGSSARNGGRGLHLDDWYRNREAGCVLQFVRGDVRQ